MRDWLVANGWDNIFLDVDPLAGLAPGERWQEEQRRAADRCQAGLCLITPEWLASDWCRSEFLLAKTLGKRMFPVIVGDVDFATLPSDLTANHQAVDVIRDPKAGSGLKRACGVLRPVWRLFRLHGRFSGAQWRSP